MIEDFLVLENCVQFGDTQVPDHRGIHHHFGLVEVGLLANFDDFVFEVEVLLDVLVCAVKLPSLFGNEFEELLFSDRSKQNGFAFF